jgi:MerR family transcriptional regulator, light-induced transcriptional regulator
MPPLPDLSFGNEEPLYNIGVVARMTGVSMATLRAWERRYRFPESERTAGGHRLYSEKDVVHLRWVKDRIDEGMQTAQAINALRHQEQTSNLTKVEALPQTMSEEYNQRSAAHLHDYKVQLNTSLANHDLAAADCVLSEALALSSPEQLILEVISPSMAAIGDAWESGRISIATEHLATSYLRQRLLMWMLSGPPPKPVKPIVLACAPDEWHEGSLLVMGALLRRRRWPVAYLGQATPLADLAGFIRDIQPSLIVLVAMTETSVINLLNWPHWMPAIAQSGKPIVAYGGRIFETQPEWRIKMTGSYLGDTFSEGIQNIERLLQQPA